jgi:hypothetical protein
MLVGGGLVEMNILLLVSFDIHGIISSGKSSRIFMLFIYIF